MPSVEAFKKRFPFRRANTSTDAIPVEEIPSEKSDEAPSSPSEAVLRADDGAPDPARNLSEVEANRRLSTFRKEHHYDPNLPNSAFDAVDEATEARNHKGEADLVGDLVENSPYPEVCRLACPGICATDIAPGSSCRPELR